MYQYISLGGWCGTKIALDQLHMVNEPINVFDYMRSSSKGIIDCIENDFSSFIPENKVMDSRFPIWKAYIGEHFGFYHSGDLTEKSSLDSIDRKIKRFIGHCNSDKKCIFLRTCVLSDYEIEMEDMNTLYEVISNKYPKLSFIIVFIIPDQEITTYYKNINDKTFVFCLNDIPFCNSTLGEQYKPIFKYISENNLFEIIPPPNKNIKITTPSSKLMFSDGNATVNYFEKFR